VGAGGVDAQAAKSSAPANATAMRSRYPGLPSNAVFIWILGLVAMECPVLPDPPGIRLCATDLLRSVRQQT
jgi:hypothetical protein